MTTPILIEKPNSRELDINLANILTGAVLHYKLAGTSSESVAYNTAVVGITAAFALATYDAFSILVRKNIKVKAVWVDTVSDTGEWDIDATYELPERQPPRARHVGEIRVQKEFGVDSAHITSCQNSIARYPSTATNYHGSINVTMDGNEPSVDGTDIEVPVTTYKIQYHLALTAYNSTYDTLVDSCIGKTNTATFTITEKQFDPVTNALVTGNSYTLLEGEGLLTAVSKPYLEIQDAQKYYIMEYEIKKSPNMTNWTPIPGLTGAIGNVNKKGWEYLWVSYGKVIDNTTTPPSMIKKPIAVYIEQPYTEVSWAGLLG